MVMATSGHQRNYSKNFFGFLSFLFVILHVRYLGIPLTFLTINKVFFYIQKSHLSDVYNKTVHVHVLVKKKNHILNVEQI